MKLRRKKISTSGTIMTVALVVLIMLPLVIMTIGAFKKNASLIQVPMDLNPFKEKQPPDQRHHRGGDRCGGNHRRVFLRQDPVPF